MKKKIFGVLLFYVCMGIIGCGTLGGFDSIQFPTSKKKLEMRIDSLYAHHPEYTIPAKWQMFNDWSERGYDFLESRIFYFKSSPEEMYYVTFIGDSLALADTNNVSIAIRAVCKGTDKWYLEKDFDSKEKERIQDRFDTAIISKLEGYTNTKSSRE